MSDFARGIQFFLGANSASGFSSLYDRWVDQAKMQAFYTIKGGAGCGKSTLMRRVADDMEKAAIRWSTSVALETQILWTVFISRRRGPH